MAVTVATCISRLQREFDDISQAIAEEYLSLADREILGRLPLREDTEDISLTSGTATYAFSAETVIRIRSAEYLKSATVTNRKTLIATSIAELDLTNESWRATQNQEPTHYYLTSTSAGAMRLGLWPTPNTTTSGGYPLVRCYIHRSASLASGGSLPAIIRKPDMYVWCAGWLYAEDYRPFEKAQEMKARFENALREEEDYLNSFLTTDAKRLVYDFPIVGVT